MTNFITEVKDDIMKLISKDCDKYKDSNYYMATEQAIQEILHNKLLILFKEIRDDNKNIYREKEETLTPK